MATYVVDLELNQPLPALIVPPEFVGVLGLVRQNGWPAGLIRLPNVVGRVAAVDLEAAIAGQVAPADDTPPPPAAPVSIVVCTRERPEDLQRCLAGLKPLVDAGHELIIVDNAPRTDATRALVERLGFRYHCEPRPGQDNARTLGLQLARHDVVAFTDDDAVPDPGWIDALAAPFQDASVGAVTGLVMPSELVTQAQELFEIYCAHRRDFTRHDYSSQNLLPAAAGVAGMGANMAVRRDLALRLGAFDPRLDGGTPTCSGGDTDMLARVLEAGFGITYTPQALVWHRHRREAAALRSCLFGYGVGVYAFLTKRLVEAGDVRSLDVAVRWWIGPWLKAARRRLTGRPAVPFSLVAVEAYGALLGPWRMLRSGRRP